MPARTLRIDTTGSGDQSHSMSIGGAAGGAPHRASGAAPFGGAAESYDRFMGRYSGLLARPFADLAGVREGQRVLDVGCGPGALTAELSRRIGPDAVTAIDPAEAYVEAARARHPSVRVMVASAEDLPFDNGAFDASLAQLVVHFMPDPVVGLREMARVTRAGGVIAACVWDHFGGTAPTSPLWAAAKALDATERGESLRPGSREGQLSDLFNDARLGAVEETGLVVPVEHPTFDDWWEPFTLGVGPAGVYVASLDPEHRERLRATCARMLPEAPFTLEVRAWAARGVVQ